MDLKTLEYMEERAGKARKIVKEINQLSKNIENVKETYKIRFLDAMLCEQFTASTGDLTNALKEVYIKIASNKIECLEQELAEL